MGLLYISDNWLMGQMPHASDGGVDVELSRSGELVIVQCKHWKSYKVGVQTVRELRGVVVSRRAQKGILVTSGVFTEETKTFAQQNPQIELVDGKMLSALMHTVRNESTISAPQKAQPSKPAAVQPTSPPVCPSCGAGMTLRLARKGANAGNQFWGCTKYPMCRGTRNA
jgi:restriction system protein